MKNAVAASCFLLAIISAAVCAGTATPVAYGVGEATAGVSATGIVSLITTLLGGAGGLWALLRKAAPSVVDVVGPLIGGVDKQVVEGGANFFESLFDPEHEVGEKAEDGACLYLVFARAKAGDAVGKDLAFALSQHVREQHAKPVAVQGGKAVK